MSWKYMCNHFYWEYYQEKLIIFTWLYGENAFNVCYYPYMTIEEFWLSLCLLQQIEHCWSDIRWLMGMDPKGIAVAFFVHFNTCTWWPELPGRNSSYLEATMLLGNQKTWRTFMSVLLAEHQSPSPGAVHVSGQSIWPSSQSASHPRPPDFPRDALDIVGQRQAISAVSCKFLSYRLCENNKMIDLSHTALG